MKDKIVVCYECGRCLFMHKAKEIRCPECGTKLNYEQHKIMIKVEKERR